MFQTCPIIRALFESSVLCGAESSALILRFSHLSSNTVNVVHHCQLLDHTKNGKVSALQPIVSELIMQKKYGQSCERIHTMGTGLCSAAQNLRLSEISRKLSTALCGSVTVILSDPPYILVTINFHPFPS